jgi:hypothetical protein
MEITQANREKLQKLLKVEVLLAGSVSELGDVIQIDCRLISMKTGKVVVAEFVEVQDVRELRNSVSKLARTIELKYLRQWMGNLSINTAPVEGEVYLDGTFVGKSSGKKALKISKLLVGEYQLRVIAGGYQENNQKIKIEAKSSLDLNVILNSLPGKLKVVSNPIGASIVLNGKNVGQTPMTLKNLKEGRYNLELALKNFLPRKKKVLVRPGQITDVNEALEVIPGSLSIESLPRKSLVYLDGKKLGVAPLVLDNLKPGSYQLKFTMAKYENKEVRIVVKPGQKVEVLETLGKQKGQLTVVSQQHDTKIKILNYKDSLIYQGSLPLHKYNIPIGFYKTEISKQQYFSKNSKLQVKANKEIRLDINLKKKPGTLELLLAEKGGDLYVDGEYIGKYRGQTLTIPEGEHKIFVQTSFGHVSGSVNVEADKLAKLDMEPPSRSPSKWWVPSATLVLLMSLILTGGF